MTMKVGLGWLMCIIKYQIENRVDIDKELLQEKVIENFFQVRKIFENI